MSLTTRLKADPKGFVGAAPLIVAGNPPLLAATHDQGGLGFGGTETVTVVEQLAAKSIIDISLAAEHGKLKLYVPAAGGDKASAYYLPWKSGHAYTITLGNQASLFTTAYMSSCALLIGGTRSAPVVIHANCGKSKRITDDTAANTDQYTVLYNALLQALVTNGTLPGNSAATPIAMHDPGLYMTGSKAGYTAVVGTLSGGDWTFWYNVNNGVTGFTGQLWPAYDKFPY